MTTYIVLLLPDIHNCSENLSVMYVYQTTFLLTAILIYFFNLKKGLRTINSSNIPYTLYT